MIDRELRRERIHMIIRWVLAIPFAFSIPIMMSLFGPAAAFFAPFFMALGAFLIAPEIVSFFSSIINGVLFPELQAERKPNYDIPESLVAKGEYEEAEAEYEKIIAAFPNEVTPHTALINIAIRRLKDVRLAEDLYLRGMSCLKKQSARETLDRVYTGMMTQIKSAEEEHPPPLHLEHQERQHPAATNKPPSQRPKWNGPKTKMKLDG
jgi:hypothetical protein